MIRMPSIPSLPTVAKVAKLPVSKFKTAKPAPVAGVPNENLFVRILNNFNRLGFGVENVVLDLQEGRVDRSKLEAFWKGFSLQEKESAPEIVRNMGFDESSRVFGFAVFAVSVGLDPATYAGLGATKIGRLAKIVSAQKKAGVTLEALKAGKWGPAIAAAQAAGKPLELGKTLAERAALRQWTLQHFMGRPIIPKKIDVVAAKLLGGFGSWAAKTGPGQFLRKAFTTSTGDPRLDALVTRLNREKKYELAAGAHVAMEVKRATGGMPQKLVDEIVQLADRPYKDEMREVLQKHVVTKKLYKEQASLTRAVVVELKKARHALSGEGWEAGWDALVAGNKRAEDLKRLGREQLHSMVNDLIEGRRGYGKGTKADMALNVYRRRVFDAVAERLEGVPTREYEQALVRRLNHIVERMRMAKEDAAGEYLKRLKTHLETADIHPAGRRIWRVVAEGGETIQEQAGKGARSAEFEEFAEAATAKRGEMLFTPADIRAGKHLVRISGPGGKIYKVPFWKAKNYLKRSGYILMEGIEGRTLLQTEVEELFPEVVESTVPEIMRDFGTSDVDKLRKWADDALNGSRKGKAGQLWERAMDRGLDLDALDDIDELHRGDIEQAVNYAKNAIGPEGDKLSAMDALATEQFRASRKLRGELSRSISELADTIEGDRAFVEQYEFEMLKKFPDHLQAADAIGIRGEALRVAREVLADRRQAIRAAINDIRAQPMVQYRRASKLMSRIEESLENVRKIRGELEAAAPSVNVITEESERVVREQFRRMLEASTPEVRKVLVMLREGYERMYAAERAAGVMEKHAEFYFPRIIGPEARKAFISQVQQHAVGKRVYTEYLSHAFEREFMDLSIMEINELCKQGKLSAEGFHQIFKEQSFLDKLRKVQPEAAEFFITDPAQAYMVRSARSVQAIHGARFRQEVLKPIADGGFAYEVIPAGKKIEIRQAVARHADTGCQAYVATGHLEDLNLPRRLADQVAAGGQLTILDPEDILDIEKLNPEKLAKAKALNAYIMPAEVVAEINRVLPMAADRQELRQFIRMSSWLNNRWKAWTLAIFPAYHLRNMIGNWWLCFLAGVRNPARFQQAMDLQNAAFRGDKARLAAMKFTNAATNEVIDGVQMFEHMNRYAVRNQGQYAVDSVVTAADMLKEKRLVHKFKGIPFAPVIDPSTSKVVDVGRQVGTAVENNARMALFIDAWTKGGTFESAADLVDKYLFDYDNLSNTMKTLRRHFVPFVTWARFNVPLEIEEMIAQPGKFLAIEKARRAIEQGQKPMPDEMVPEWLRDNWAVQYAREGQRVKFFLLGSWLPAGDIARVVGALESPDNFASYAGSFLTPFIREPLEQLINKDLYFKTEIERYKGEMAMVGPLIMSKRSAHMLHNIRLINEIDKIDPGGICVWTAVKLGILPPSALTTGRPHKVELDRREKLLKVLGFRPAVVDIQKRKRILEIDAGKRLGLLKAAKTKAEQEGLKREAEKIAEQLKAEQGKIGIIREYQ